MRILQRKGYKKNKKLKPTLYFLLLFRPTIISNFQVRQLIQIRKVKKMNFEVVLWKIDT